MLYFGIYFGVGLLTWLVLANLVELNALEMFKLRPHRETSQAVHSFMALLTALVWPVFFAAGVVRVLWMFVKIVPGAFAATARATWYEVLAPPKPPPIGVDLSREQIAGLSMDDVLELDNMTSALKGE